ncbi:MAG: hypothetical protein SGARI_007111 [Bacillariaceae sp.]
MPAWKPTPETFPELPTVILWMRFIFAVCFGFYVGLTNNERGAVNLLYALNLVTFVPTIYVSFYLGAKLEDFGNKLIFGGAFQGLALVLLIWIYFYTQQHEADEAAFAAIFHKAADEAAEASADSAATGSESLKSEFVKPVVEESEF